VLCISFHHFNVYVENFPSYVPLYLYVCYVMVCVWQTEIKKLLTYLSTPMILVYKYDLKCSKMYLRTKYKLPSSALLEVRALETDTQTDRQTHRQMRPNTLPRRIRGWYQFAVGDHYWKCLPNGPIVTYDMIDRFVYSYTHHWKDGKVISSKTCGSLVVLNRCVHGYVW